MAQRLRSRATAAVAAGLAAACIAMAAGPAFADTVRNQEWWLNSLHVTKAWLSSRGAGVTVAVLDTGVDPGQADLTGSVSSGTDFTGSGRTPGGAFWGMHGTAVASLIAGHGHGRHRANGIIGIAPMAKILSVRVTLESTDPLLASATSAADLSKAIARGIRYAVKQGAQVIELPLDPVALAGGTTSGGSASEASAVAAALRKGVVLVAPAGDAGAGANTVNYPAAYPGVIAVGAFDQTFTKAAFTSQRPYVTVTAPGSGVIAADGQHGYAQLKSTSAASAVVAGIAALIRSQFPTLTPAQVTQALTSGTVFRPKTGKQIGSGSGTVDASAALVAAAQINAALPTSKPSAGNAGPTPPAAPVVKVKTPTLWHALRYPVLGVASILLLGLVILIVVRVRQRRALDAQLAPLRAAAQASRRPPLTEEASFSSTGQPGSGSVSTGAVGAGHLAAGTLGPGSLAPGSVGRGSVSQGAATSAGSVRPQPVSGAPPWVVQSAAQPPAAEPAGWATAGPSPTAQPDAERPSVSSPGSSASMGSRPGGGGSMGTQARPSGSPGNRSAAGRPAFGRAPFDDPGFEIPSFDRPSFSEPSFSEPSFSGPGFGGSSFDDRAFGSAAADNPSFGNGSPSGPSSGNGAPGEPSSRNGSASRPPFGNDSPSGPPFGNGSPGRPPFGNSSASGPPSGSAPAESPFDTDAGWAGSSSPAAEDLPPGIAPFSGTPFGGTPFGSPPFGGAASGTSGSATRGGTAPGGVPPADASSASAPQGGAPLGGTPSGGPPSGAPTSAGAAPEADPFGRPAAGEPPIPPGRIPGSTHRLNPVRTPKSSGHPPWEPADRPDGELPWMDTPPPGGAHNRLIPPRRAFPGSASAVPGVGAQDASAPEADRNAGPAPADVSRDPASGASGPSRRAGRDRGPFPELDEPPSTGARDPFTGAPGAENPGDRPIYSWNPSDTTEAFPKVRPPEEASED
jgi:hypothetical protein